MLAYKKKRQIYQVWHWVEVSAGRRSVGSSPWFAAVPVISANLRDISTPFGFVETKKRDAVLWKQDSFYPVPRFQVRFKRWQEIVQLY